jgi:hypothetical protein
VRGEISGINRDIINLMSLNVRAEIKRTTKSKGCILNAIPAHL